jgi:hypothetical protein
VCLLYNFAFALIPTILIRCVAIATILFDDVYLTLGLIFEIDIINSMRKWIALVCSSSTAMIITGVHGVLVSPLLFV